MRLPILTAEHQSSEDARQHNEALYLAFLAREPITVPVTPETVHQVQLKQSGDYRRFWLARGFRIRTKRNKPATVLSVWLEPITDSVHPGTEGEKTGEYKERTTKICRAGTVSVTSQR